MKIPFCVVDAFITESPFSGNPAAVCPLESWLEDPLLQGIAMQQNLSETAFTVPTGENRFQIRWFTPKAEVDLCGHATLATAAVHLEDRAGVDTLHFESRSGPLHVRRLPSAAGGERFELDFPVLEQEAAPFPGELTTCLDPESVLAVYRGMDVMVVVREASIVRDFEPDLLSIARLGSRGLIVTAETDGGDPFEDVDIVTRYFAPQYGVDEDPVTGSIHCALVPVWAERLGRKELRSRQISRRGGILECTLRGDRVGIAGRVRLFSRGTLFL